jgi:hypothetical protein
MRWGVMEERRGGEGRVAWGVLPWGAGCVWVEVGADGVEGNIMVCFVLLGAAAAQHNSEGRGQQGMAQRWCR